MSEKTSISPTDFAQDLINYINESPSPHHCVEATARRLLNAGFIELDFSKDWANDNAATLPSKAFIRKHGSLIAFRSGTRPLLEDGMLVLGAHTDSPNLRLKPRAELEQHGFQQLAVQPYGGVLLSTWLDRDLGVSGMVYGKKDGEHCAKLFCINEPIARVPNLAIHLNRTVNKEGLKVNAERHLRPILSATKETSLLTLIQKETGLDEVLSIDLGLHDVVPATIGGLHREYVFSPRLDNQASCYQILSALTALNDDAQFTVGCFFDHEEVGSRSATGAMGSFLKSTLTQIINVYGDSQPNTFERVMSRSFCVSIDMAHGLHPNYGDMHDIGHRPTLNGGPVIKEHVEQRYATNGYSRARFVAACQNIDVPYQDFAIRADLACGSTIGPITAAGLAIETIDVGSAMLSMHSIREQCGALDLVMMRDVLIELAKTKQ